VVLDGQEIHRLPTKEVARRLGLLPQTPIAPDGMSVADLVARGRTPHQRLFQQWSAADEAAVTEALAATHTLELAHRRIDELSGGQRQRVWIAMALAQQTDLLLLDEPTTFLDITHQIEVLELIASLNRTRSRTVVVVLHDLNLACRYAHHLVAMRDGHVVAEGRPVEVITEAVVRSVFDLDAVVIDDPVCGTPLVVPRRVNAANRRPADHGESR
jgi:iron complex transport system ATP-binding protein